MGGYAQGSFAPNRCSDWQNLNCSGGNAATEPYIASHYQILAHAAAVKLYRDKYQVCIFVINKTTCVTVIPKLLKSNFII